MPLPSPNARTAARLRTAADLAEALEATLPRAYREQGPPELAELAEHAHAIDELRHMLLDTAVVLVARPHPATAERAETRTLATAAERLGQATASINQAVAMASRIHEASGLGSQQARDTREGAVRDLNLSLSHTRIAVRETVDQLRVDARQITASVQLAPDRGTAANARSATGNGRVLVAPAARTADLPLRAAARRP
jgi:hypothetical protein